MISLNLLELEKKVIIQKIKIFELVKNLSIFFLLLTCLVTIVVFATDLFLKRLFTEVIEQSTLVSRSFSSTKREIRAINETLLNINALQEQYVPWSTVLQKIYKTVPTGVRLTSLTINHASLAANIRGVAAKRNDLINFQKTLESSGLFSKISSPLSNLVARENIDFELKTVLQSEAIKKE